MSIDPERLAAYSEIIIEHSQFPRQHGKLAQPDCRGQGENPFCGDRISLELAIDDSGMITGAAFEATGCAISLASASLLVSHIEGLTREQAGQVFTRVRSLITRGPDGEVEASLGELAALSFAAQYPSRVKCATLAWHVLKHALDGDESVATSEA
jgi:nitrogen fixation NifU-like protein